MITYKHANLSDIVNKPKMLLFDYGHMLCHEPGFNFIRGNAALLKFAINNPNNYCAEDVSRFANELYNNSNMMLILELQRRKCHSGKSAAPGTFHNTLQSTSFKIANETVLNFEATGEIHKCSIQVVEFSIAN